MPPFFSPAWQQLIQAVPPPPIPVPSFLSEEWQRFLQGLRELDPQYLEILNNLTGKGGTRPGTIPTVTIPGWETILQLGNRPLPTAAEWREYAQAKRQNRPPNLDPATANAIEARIAQMEAFRSSASPGYLKGWIKIMTAIDNVQDFASSVATLGRLTLWLGSKIGLRAIPGLGTAVLIGDILNLMNLLGTISMPIYGILCGGPSGALAAGAPGILGKRLLKAEAWSWANLNPFSRTATASRALRTAGRLPSIGNLLELAQTTNQLFGWGISLGSLYGMVTEFASAVELNLRGIPVKLNWEPFILSLRRPTAAHTAAMNTADLAAAYRAGQVLAQAPLLLTSPHAHPQWLIYETITALIAATGQVHQFWAGLDHEQLISELLDGLVIPPGVTPPHTAEEAAIYGISEATTGDWPLEGLSGAVIADLYAGTLGAAVAAGTEQTYSQLRGSPLANFVGAAVNQLTEQLFTMLTGDDHFLKWRLTPTWQLLVSMAEEGWLLRAGEHPDRAQRFWTTATDTLERTGHSSLSAIELATIANEAGIDLFHILGPDQPLPDNWLPYLDWLTANVRPQPAQQQPTEP